MFSKFFGWNKQTAGETQMTQGAEQPQKEQAPTSTTKGNTKEENLGRMLWGATQARVEANRSIREIKALAYYYAMLAKVFDTLSVMTDREVYKLELSKEGQLVIENENGSHIRLQMAPIPETLVFCSVMISHGWEMKSDAKGYAEEYILKIPQWAP